MLALACEQPQVEPKPVDIPFLQISSSWVDSLLQTMTIEEKIGQLILLQTSVTDSLSRQRLFDWVRAGRLGGYLIENVPLEDFISISDSCQDLSAIGLFSGTNEKVTLQRQFSDLKAFPLPASIAAIDEDSVHNNLSDLMVQQCQALGINFSFAATVSSNSIRDTTFDFQSFESDEQAIYDRSSLALENLQENNILSFGDRFADYRIIEDDTLGLLDSILIPYSNLTQYGLSGLLVDEQVMEIDTFDRMPVGYLKKYLKEELEFDGLLVGRVNPKSGVDKLARVGADLFIVEEDLNQATKSLKRLYKEGILSNRMIDEKVAKVLLAKAWLGIDSTKSFVSREQAYLHLMPKKYERKAKQLYERSVILAHNPKSILPLKDLEKRSFQILQYGQEQLKSFQRHFSKYCNYTFQLLPPEKSTGSLKPISNKFARRATVVVTIDHLDIDPVRDGEFLNSLNKLSQSRKVLLVNYGNSFNLQYLDTSIAKLQIFERNDITEAVAAQLIFGANLAEGTLPQTIADHLPYGKGLRTDLTRLKYSEPEEVGIAPEKLVGIDALVRSAIASGATPGCQVLVAKDGQIIYSKAFGHHTYEKEQRVNTGHLYDIASITKVAATTLVGMKIYEQRKFMTNDRLSDHLDLAQKSTIRYEKLKYLFTHRSRLQSNMPIAEYILYKDTTGADCNPYYCKSEQEGYRIKVADQMFLHSNYLDSMWHEVQHLKLRKSTKYRYSDVNFNLLQKVFETKTNQALDQLVYQNFYNPLNIQRVLYNPLEKYPSSIIVPTQDDQKFRKQLLRGYVHDEAAALMGGVAGNAGLFANAEDLVIIFQMLLNGGTYGGKRFLKKETIEFFTSPFHGNHRGLGFDRKGKNRLPSMARSASPDTYGHTGFTGTCVWVDPSENLIFIFLSNRINPDVNNRKLFRLRLRGRVHQVVYDALDTYQDENEQLENILKINEARISFRNDDVFQSITDIQPY